MLLKYLTIGVAAAATVLATGTEDTKHCNANNCLRAVRATRISTRLAEASADCSAFYTAPSPSIPTYATACRGDAAFKSACACISVLPPDPTVAPPVVLPSPTAVFGDVVNGSPSNYDDPFAPLTLPFPITIYGISSADIFLSVNGFFSLIDSPSTTETYPSYSNGALPVHVDIVANFPSYLPPLSVCGFWDDLYVYQGTQQGIYYQIDGTSPGSRSISFEFYTSHFNAPAEYYHFLMKYDEAVPNVVTVQYFQVSDGGSSATIGAQSSDDFVQWSYNTPGSVFAGLKLKIDTTPGTDSVTAIP
ncbi:hypothetical protein TWF696_009015 [Orbilia brochopaga]|uniref:Uncharacterized protein n=1 Tax=Orbilia brochopaga TaxID=3140254 RepID=A0AAV9UGA7_9PEZI